MPIYMSPSVKAKLSRPDHSVTEQEIVQCFANRDRTYLTDTRPEHQTPTPTLWFVSETDYGRRLKVVFIKEEASSVIDIKSAYPATAEVARIYKKYSQQLI